MAKEMFSFGCLVLCLLVTVVEAAWNHPDYGPCVTCTWTGNPDFPYACCGEMCDQPACVDAYRPSGACCWECPNGLNCQTPWGEVIKGYGTAYNQTVGLKCKCHSSYNYHDPETTPEPLQATCSEFSGSIPTTVPPTTDYVTTPTTKA